MIAFYQNDSNDCKLQCKGLNQRDVVDGRAGDAADRTPYATVALLLTDYHADYPLVSIRLPYGLYS